MPSAKKKPIVKVEPKPTTFMPEAEPTNRDVINYVNNTMLQIMAYIDQQKYETIEELKRLLDSPKPASAVLPVKHVLPVNIPETECKPWYKNWFAWVLSIIVLALIGYGIYILIMVESGKRIVIPWAH